MPKTARLEGAFSEDTKWIFPVSEEFTGYRRRFRGFIFFFDVELSGSNLGDFSNEKRKKRKEKTGESCQSVDLQEDPHADLVPLQHLLARLPHMQLPLDVTFSAALLQVEGGGRGLRLGGVR